MGLVKTNVTPSAPASSFRQLLQSELARRCAANPQYSLRAFAMHLEIDHSTLSQMIRGKRALTAAAIERLGGKLGLSSDAIAAWIAREKTALSAGAGGPREREVMELTRDAVSLVTDWWHYAILELTRLESFRADSRWVARVLGIEVDDVNRALSALLHVGLMEMRADRWIDTSGDTAASFGDFARATLERLSEQVRKLSLSADESVPPPLRDRTSTTVAVATASVPEAIEMIARFRREILGRLERDATRDAVYHLEIDFFPLTRRTEKE